MSAPTLSHAMTEWRIKILNLAANGHTNAQIGARYGHTGNAINCHLQVIYRAIGANDRAHAVALGIRYGYINPASVEPAPARDAT
jgi:DNA-binding NarL/FixJ family response regulator